MIDQFISYLQRRQDTLLTAAEAGVESALEEWCEVDDLLRAAQEFKHHGGATAAVSPSQAQLYYAHEQSDPLPTGRQRHAPFMRQTPEERRRATVKVMELRTAAGKPWFAPLFYATQEYADPAERRYWYGVFARECQFMYEAGLVTRRLTGKRGARYEYRLLGVATGLRSVS